MIDLLCLILVVWLVIWSLLQLVKALCVLLVWCMCAPFRLARWIWRAKPVPGPVPDPVVPVGLPALAFSQVITVRLPDRDPAHLVRAWVRGRGVLQHEAS